MSYRLALLIATATLLMPFGRSIQAAMFSRLIDTWGQQLEKAFQKQKFQSEGRASVVYLPKHPGETLVLKSKLFVVANRIVIQGKVYSEGHPLDLKADTIEFTKQGYLHGYRSNSIPTNPDIKARSKACLIIPKAPNGETFGKHGKNGQDAQFSPELDGLNGNSQPSPVKLQAEQIAGDIKIQLHGQNGENGQQGCIGGDGGDGYRGADSSAVTYKEKMCVRMGFGYQRFRAGKKFSLAWRYKGRSRSSCMGSPPRCVEYSYQTRCCVKSQRDPKCSAFSTNGGYGGYGGQGGQGGRGGNGGRGGRAIGLIVETASSYPADSVNIYSYPGSGGLGGSGGNGGKGGQGAKGGRGQTCVGSLLHAGKRGQDGFQGERGERGQHGSRGQDKKIVWSVEESTEAAKKKLAQLFVLGWSFHKLLQKTYALLIPKDEPKHRLKEHFKGLSFFSQDALWKVFYGEPKEKGWSFQQILFRKKLFHEATYQKLKEISAEAKKYCAVLAAGTTDPLSSGTRPSTKQWYQKLCGSWHELYKQDSWKGPIERYIQPHVFDLPATYFHIVIERKSTSLYRSAN